MDILTKVSYDADHDVAFNAILALGLIGAGTNNSRVSGNLRQLASYYYKDPDHLFVVRIAQGLVHMGKGLIGVNPIHSDNFLVYNVGLAGIITVLFSAADMKSTLMGNHNYLLYYLVLAMYPRMMVTLNENLENLTTSVRVGQAVDTVAQAGQPKSITGF
jgi:26S proteasome regulatory subunit N1